MIERNARTSIRTGVLIAVPVVVLYGCLFSHVLRHPQAAFLADSVEYLDQARNMLHYGFAYAGKLTAPVDPLLLTRRTPGYPLFLLALIAVCDCVGLLILANILLALLGVFLLWRVLGYFDASARLRTACVLLYLLHPTQALLTNLLMADILFQVMVLGGLVMIIEFTTKDKIRYLVLSNVILAAGVLVKGVLVYFWLPSLLLHYVPAVRYKRKGIAFLPLLLLLAVGAWSFRNFRITGCWHYTSTKATNLLLHNAKHALAPSLGPEGAGAIVDGLHSRALDQAGLRNQIRLMESFSREIISEHFSDYLGQHLAGVVNLFADPGRFELFQFFSLEFGRGLMAAHLEQGYPGILRALLDIPVPLLVLLTVTVGANLLLFVSFLVFAVDLVRNSEHRNEAPRWFLALICVYIPLVVGPVGSARYRLAIQPLLIATLPLFAVTASGWWTRLGEHLGRSHPE